ncbi:MAG: DUF4340 domain-containing protein [Candidatus Thiodiazotropha sp. (ex Myrtea spinifera)]|nr:DUF4340 domain-containing protein [Candidatus Thiodiazotropha sp. (ex Myrtea spinifera)]
MDRRLRINLVLLLTVCVLGLLVWLSQQSGGLPSLTNLQPEGITRIEISDLSGRHILLQRERDTWRIGNEPANQPRIQQLLQLCQTPSLERFDPPADLHPFGLETPPIMMKLNGESLAFGNTDPVNGWRYVRYADQIHLIADGFYHHLRAPREAWLDSP